MTGLPFSSTRRSSPRSYTRKLVHVVDAPWPTDTIASSQPSPFTSAVPMSDELSSTASRTAAPVGPVTGELPEGAPPSSWLLAVWSIGGFGVGVVVTAAAHDANRRATATGTRRRMAIRV